MTDGYMYEHFLQTFFKSIAEEGAESKFNSICKDAHPEYEVDNVCGFNIAMAFIDARRFLETHVSKRTEDWAWGKVHVVEWSNLPWSKTPLKFMWNREIHTGGNGNTVHVSKYSNRLNANRNIIRSHQSPSYK